MLIRSRAACTIAVLGVLAAAPVVQATPILSEGFDSVAALAGAGWVLTNNSTPGGATGWFQGNDSVFPAQAYIAANYLNSGLDGNISNWLLTPTRSIQNGDTLTFWTRTEVGSLFPDRLEVRMSTAGSSFDVGSSDTSFGDFSTLLLSINPSLSVGTYPEAWTRFSVSVSGLGAAAEGRYAFRYFVSDTSLNANYIGIDTVSVEAVPEPSTLLLLASGGVALLRRRRQGLS
jgi:PEP-CTERM motif